ncbi:MAG TPA: hypothetical protein VLR46_06290 [Candidatus Dormibacteraeota bacterium]|nr:hypothetical protein [Candidatus Dormibacteraeota bacterium]
MNLDADAVLVHQVHPVKLAFDISASIISNVLLWQHRLAAGLVTRYALPVAGSALVLAFADLDRLRSTARAGYVLEHMPPASTALRFGGDTLMAVGAWRRHPSWLVAGALIVAAGWSHGLFFEPISRDR